MFLLYQTKGTTNPLSDMLPGFLVDQNQKTLIAAESIDEVASPWNDSTVNVVLPDGVNVAYPGPNAHPIARGMSQAHLAHIQALSSLDYTEYERTDWAEMWNLFSEPGDVPILYGMRKSLWDIGEVNNPTGAQYDYAIGPFNTIASYYRKFLQASVEYVEIPFPSSWQYGDPLPPFPGTPLFNVPRMEFQWSGKLVLFSPIGRLYIRGPRISRAVAPSGTEIVEQQDSIVSVKINGEEYASSNTAHPEIKELNFNGETSIEVDVELKLKSAITNFFSVRSNRRAWGVATSRPLEFWLSSGTSSVLINLWK